MIDRVALIWKHSRIVLDVECDNNVVIQSDLFAMVICDLLRGYISDLKLVDKKVTLNHLEYVWFSIFFWVEKHEICFRFHTPTIEAQVLEQRISLPRKSSKTLFT